MFLDIDRTCGWKADLLGCRKSAATPDARISKMSVPSALNCKDTKHLKNANIGNSTSLFPDPKSVSGGLQSPQTSGTVPSNSRGALQHSTSTVSCRRPLDGDVSARVVEVFTHVDCTCGAQRQNYDLIAEMQLRPHSGDPSFQDWRCWRKHTTCNTGRIKSPQFCNLRKLISGF